MNLHCFIYCIFKYQLKMINFKCRIFLNPKLYSCRGIFREVFKSNYAFSFPFCYFIEKEKKREKGREKESM